MFASILLLAYTIHILVLLLRPRLFPSFNVIGWLWWPVSTVGDFVGDSMISITETLGLKRPCEKKTVTVVKSYRADHDPIATLGRFLGKFNGYPEYDFATPMGQDILRRIATRQLYVAPNGGANRRLPFLSLVHTSTFPSLSNTERSELTTGPLALEHLALAKNCGTDTTTENKWATFGLSPRQPVVTYKRAVKVIFAAGAIYFTPIAGATAYAKASAGMAEAIASGTVASTFGPGTALAVEQSMAMGMSAETVAALSGVSASVTAVKASSAAYKKCADSETLTPTCLSLLYKG